MQTPVADFLERYARSGTVRLHMPGHKGKGPGFPTPLDSVFPYDITEIQGADALYEAEGILEESEQNMAALYGAAVTCYSAGGSTLCIQAMLAAACRPGDTVIAGRNAHHAFLNACTLLDLTPRWVLPEYNDAFGVSGEVTAGQVRRTLASCPEAAAVYVTSPDYLGCMSDIGAIASVCREAGVPLLVDNAHGAHLRFLSRDSHPMTCGASLCCDSAHKTLPALTGGAYLHASQAYLQEQGADEREMRARLKEAMGLFGSTSPSYLILLSLDLCTRYLSERGREDFCALEGRAAEWMQAAGRQGFAPISARMDPTKLTLDAGAIGWDGRELAAHFRAYGVECEYAAQRHMVLMAAPQNTSEDWAAAYRALSALQPRDREEEELPPFVLPEQVLSLREARFAPRRCVPVEEAEGCIAAETRIHCPPGVPIVVAGERIGSRQQKLLKRSGISLVFVIN